MKKIKLIFKANKAYFKFILHNGILMIVLQIFLLFLSVPMNLIQLYAPKNFLDTIVYDNNFNNAILWIILLILSNFIFVIINHLITCYREFVCSKAKLEAKIEAYKQIDNKYLSYFEDNEKMNNIQRALTYADNGGNSVYLFITSLISSILSLITISYISIKFEWWLFLLVIGVFLLRILISNKSKKKNFNFEKEQVNRNRITGYYSSVLSQKKYLQELKIYNSNNFFIEKFKKSWVYNLKLKTKFKLKMMALYILEITPEKFLSLICYIVIGIKLIQNSITLGDYTLFFSMINQLNGILGNLRGIVNGYYEQVLSAQNYLDLIDNCSECIEDEDKTDSLKNSSINSIVLKDITFRYNNQHIPAINNLSLTIHKGEKISIVGINGAGKTTLINLILSLYKPNSGEIYINSIPTSAIEIKSYWEKIGVVFQNHNVYSVTIAENILFNENPDSEKVISVLEMVNLKDKVIGFENGINTLVSPSLHKGGVDFSGGERQKIAIARAFAKNCDLYIFDEPSSALDARSEDELFNIIKSLPEDKTVIFISHRLSSVSASDRIIVMKNGCIIGDGSHDSLMRDCKEYFDMYSVQAKRYGATI